ncbi:MAG: hypothetical protein NO516_03335 [Candidatus Methanomethylicia archaeon]|nr:hypothetical protein [Candidatus Methanomethylicia archaeon]
MSFEEVAMGLKYDQRLLEMLVGVYGPRTRMVLEALKTPPREYALRVNMLKADPDDVVSEFEAMGVRCRRSQVLDEAITIEVDGPFTVRERGARITADKFAAESVMLGSNLYEPGVLRSERVRPGDEVHVADIYGHVVGSGIAHFSSARPHTKGVAMTTTESVYRLPQIRETAAYAEGRIQEQSLPAMLVARILDPEPGEVVVDMCSAPGTKALHVAQIQGDRGTVYAFDNAPNRVAKIRSEIRRIGIKSVRAIPRDSRYIKQDFPSMIADKVIVDPPCTALGVRPKLYEDAKASDVEACSVYQRQFLETAASIVKEGGEIIYSTCTLTLEENEGVVEYAIESLGLELAPQDPLIGSGGLKGLMRAQRFDPDRTDTPGYFIAKFLKR